MPVSGGTSTIGLTQGNNLAELTNVATARTNLGLGSVDNTPDASKPVSTAQAAAIAAVGGMDMMMALMGAY